MFKEANYFPLSCSGKCGPEDSTSTSLCSIEHCVIKKYWRTEV